MKTILVTAYAVNPYKGSEDGMGWNGILQIAKNQAVIAVTRENNRPAVDQYFSEHPELEETHQPITFLYYDLPKWTRWWKKGPLLSMIYFYMWQLGLPFFIKKQGMKFDVAHNFNFHNDWTPSFLWLLGKPLVWGPIGHHPLVPKQHLMQHGISAFLKDRALWLMKNVFWHLDPFLWITKIKAKKIICMNSSVATKLNLSKDKYIIIPSVAVERPKMDITHKKKEKFTVMIAARMVPLKGFDMAIHAFASFLNTLEDSEKSKTELLLIGSGPLNAKLQQQVSNLGIEAYCQFIPWIERVDLLNKYNDASAFLFPSHEGAGMVVAEALSYGVPVICYDNYGPGELVPPFSQLKVPLCNYNDEIEIFKNKLLDLFSSISLQKHESILAQEHFNHWLHWDIRGEQYKTIYNELFNYEQNIRHSFA
ncbi:glycosyltransferase [Fulvivirga ligni]|uniref:glycosyltransferase n=1 Tax=Fulvivirga ligni TaxID=2904246 RepID=UPI001F22B146|nr:glycosyltransferase [Fulvivirga ligni]UII21335.1 glycosyltransferase [Fulvivirga ligni]